jgi:hypothetical protein
MNYLADIYNLDWKKYSDLLYNSISFQYFPKENIDIKLGKIIQPLYKLEKDGVIYLPIPKNASTSIENSFDFSPIKSPLQREFPFYIDIPEKYINEYKFFIITRDPKERWISGINEFLNIYCHEGVDFDGNIKGSRSKFLNELKNNKFIFDFHTMPQLTFISFCFRYNIDITFLKLDQNLNEKISNILKRKVLITHDNPTQKFKFKLKNYKFCYDILTKYCMKNKNFLDLYKMDFYLYDNSF